MTTIVHCPCGFTIVVIAGTGSATATCPACRQIHGPAVLTPVAWPVAAPARTAA